MMIMFFLLKIDSVCFGIFPLKYDWLDLILKYWSRKALPLEEDTQRVVLKCFSEVKVMVKLKSVSLGTVGSI